MIIAAFKKGETRCYTKNMHQFDKGQKLIVTGIALPDSFEVHISNQKDGGMAAAYHGTAEGVYIPDAFFVSGDYIYVWLYATETFSEGSEGAAYQRSAENEAIEEAAADVQTIYAGETVYEIVIPVIRRSIQLPTAGGQPSGGWGYVIGEDETLIPVIQ